MVNAWNVGELDQMVLPPCHYGFQMYTRELSLEERIELYKSKTGLTEVDRKFQLLKDFEEHNIPTRAISLMWNQRSVDTFLGLPFNIASYGLLLEMLAKEVNMVPDQLIGSLGDVHLYSNHIDQAKEQIEREGFDLPIVKLSSGHNLRAAVKGNFDEIDPNDIMLINYQSHSAIKAPLSN
jgi:thymidylate synthase